MVTLAMVLSACGQTAVRPWTRFVAGPLPRPARILILDVLTDGAKVTEYTGILRQQPANADPTQRRRELRENATATFESVLMIELESLGFAVPRVSRETPVARDELIIDARLLAVHQGDPLRRLVIGFGSGASKFETIVSVYQGPERRKLLEFTTLADSGRMPGAAVTLPAGAAVHGGITAGLFASSAVSSGVSAYHTNVAQMAASSADQAVRYLSEFFADQRWIPAHRVKKARIAFHPQPMSETNAR